MGRGIGMCIYQVSWGIVGGPRGMLTISSGMVGGPRGMLRLSWVCSV